MHRRRASDRTPSQKPRWTLPFLASAASLRAVTWEDQRTQFVTRYVFWALGLAYFNLGGVVARSAEFLVAVNVVHGVYVLLTTVYLLHARRNRLSPLRWRVAMWTDLIAVSFMALADLHVTSPAYLVFLAIIIGNGMRYGLRPFAEAALGSFLLVTMILYLRFADYVSALSVAAVFFFLFGAVFVVYAFSLMARVERQREEVAARSSLDQLTGLLNRRGLEERAANLFLDVATHGRPLSVLFADLDGFKSINDALGHHVGDAVLKKVAGLISASVRDTDVAARYGGDEFVVLMPDTTLDQALGVAGRLQDAVGQWAKSGAVHLSLSIGMGQAPGHGAELAVLLQRVDGAMYLSKQSNSRGGIRCVDDVPARTADA
jgi:diguanylate cyclase (GGDEF)-like protein